MLNAEVLGIAKQCFDWLSLIGPRILYGASQTTLFRGEQDQNTTCKVRLATNYEPISSLLVSSLPCHISRFTGSHAHLISSQIFTPSRTPHQQSHTDDTLKPSKDSITTNTQKHQPNTITTQRHQLNSTNTQKHDSHPQKTLQRSHHQ